MNGAAGTNDVGVGGDVMMALECLQETGEPSIVNDFNILALELTTKGRGRSVMGNETELSERMDIRESGSKLSGWAHATVGVRGGWDT